MVIKKISGRPIDLKYAKENVKIENFHHVKFYVMNYKLAKPILLVCTGITQYGCWTM